MEAKSKAETEGTAIQSLPHMWPIYIQSPKLGFGRKASSQNVISKQEECLKELEELKFEIQKCQFERDELYQILDLYIYDEWDHRLHVELPVLQSEHEMRMMAMQMMTNSISDAMERYKELIQVNSSYRIRHSQLLREQAQLKNNIQILMNEKRELLVEQTELPAYSVETKRLWEEAGMNICDPSATNSRSEILQQKLEHDTDQDKISLGEKSYRRRTKCAQQIHHYCVSSVMSIAIVDCIFLL
ncbi:uncharacterized protein LOC134480535 isoform X2 [Rattus norvegicus]|uniref:Disks large homolog 5 N-terminal domain-containing protein n=1 Tax=Rattus norvegicus TaxID=10116 RepID=A0ABK0KWH1_RAT